MFYWPFKRKNYKFLDKADALKKKKNHACGWVFGGFLEGFFCFFLGGFFNANGAYTLLCAKQIFFWLSMMEF
jgi:hypothetical protein